MKEHIKILLISSGISMVLLIFFFILHYNDAKILTLNDKWLLISGLPILIGLFISGVIKNFKGFGLELETNLSEKVELNLVEYITNFSTPKIEKGSINILDQMSDSDKIKIERIQFIYGKEDYYNSNDINDYFNKLEKLKFIEIIDENNKFIALLPIKQFKNNNDNYEKIRKLILSIEQKKIYSDFNNCVTDYINKNDTLIEAYKKFNQSKQGKSYGDQILPVINDESNMIGIAYRNLLSNKIIDKVIKVSNT